MNSGDEKEAKDCSKNFHFIIHSVKNHELNTLKT